MDIQARQETAGLPVSALRPVGTEDREEKEIMKLLKSYELRKLYLDFFREKGHAIIPSASLIPENDPTVLFTTAGMHPLCPI